MARWTQSEDDRLRELYPSLLPEDTDKAFPGRTRQAIYTRANTLGLKKSDEVNRILKERFLQDGKGTRFTAGHEPATKGRKRSEWLSPDKEEKVRATQFRKGNIPANLKPTGWTRRDMNGYVQVKTEQGWRFMHRLAWEERNGAIPDGHIIRDGKAVTRQDNMLMNCIHRYPPELARLMRANGQLGRIIRKMEEK